MVVAGASLSTDAATDAAIDPSTDAAVAGLSQVPLDATL